MKESDKIKNFTKTVLKWARESKSRDRYPWRKENDLYKSLIAEILLQRTKRNQVIEVYHSIIHKYPTPEKLAKSTEENIQKIIHSLGLRKRARYLIESSKYLVGKSSRLLGVGEYSRRVLLLKSGVRTPLPVDRNVARVLQRYFGITIENKKRPDKDVRILKTADSFSTKKPEKVLELLWGLLDISEEFCLPKTPRCESCPLKRGCTHAREHYLQRPKNISS